MKNLLIAIGIGLLLVGCPQRRGNSASQSAAASSSKAGGAAADYQAYEDSIVKALKDNQIQVTVTDDKKLRIGIAKFMKAKTITSTSGMIIVVGRPTEWEGVIQASGAEIFDKDARPIGIKVNNLGSTKFGGDILCFFIYGNISDAAREALTAVIKCLE
jgi:hypothetical protein